MSAAEPAIDGGVAAASSQDSNGSNTGAGSAGRPPEPHADALLSAESIEAFANQVFIAAGGAPDESRRQLPEFATTVPGLVKQLLLLHLDHAWPHVRNQVLLNVREYLLGIDRIKALILEGHTPEFFENLLATHEQLVCHFRFVASYIALLSLGVAIAHSLQPFKTIAGGDGEDDEEATTIARLSASVEHISLLPSASDDIDSLPAIDYSPLVTFIEDLKAPGLPLHEDPEWEDHGKKPKHRWDRRLSTALEQLGKRFHTATMQCEERWSNEVDLVRRQLDDLGTEGDTLAIFKELISSADLTLPHVPLGPSGGSGRGGAQINLATESQRLCGLAFAFKQHLHKRLLAVADGVFAAKNGHGDDDDVDALRGFQIYQAVMWDAPLIETETALHRNVPPALETAFKAGRASIYSSSPEYISDCFQTAFVRLMNWKGTGNGRLMDRTHADSSLLATLGTPGDQIVAKFKRKVARMGVRLNKHQDEQEEKEEEESITYGKRIAQGPEFELQQRRQGKLLVTWSREILREQAVARYKLWLKLSAEQIEQARRGVGGDHAAEVANAVEPQSSSAQNAAQTEAAGASHSDGDKEARPPVKEQSVAAAPSTGIPAAVDSLDNLARLARDGLMAVLDLDPTAEKILAELDQAEAEYKAKAKAESGPGRGEEVKDEGDGVVPSGAA